MAKWFWFSLDSCLVKLKSGPVHAQNPRYPPARGQGYSATKQLHFFVITGYDVATDIASVAGEVLPLLFPGQYGYYCYYRCECVFIGIMLHS